MEKVESRTERIADILEKQFLTCSEFIAVRTEPGSGYVFPFDLIKVGTQLAGMIIRLEACRPRIAENSGSIPQ